MNDAAPEPKRPPLREARPPERMPPNDVELEAVVISHIFLKPAEYDLVAGVITSEHFYAPRHKFIWDAITALASQGKSYDTAAVASWLRDNERLAQVGGTPYLAQVTDATPAASNVVQHAKVLREKWRLRQAIGLHHNFVAAGYATPTDGVQEFLEAAERQLADLAHQTTEASLELVAQIMARNLQYLAEAKARGDSVTGQSTGFTDLDLKTGGMYDGDLYVLAGRPGMGKTSCATSLAANVARPQNGLLSTSGVAFFSLEMPREQLATRFACAEAGVSAADVRRNQMTDEQLTALTAATQALSKFPLWIDDTAALNVLEVRSRTRRLQREIELGVLNTSATRLGLVVVDYLQLMQGERARGGSREQEVSSISQGLKRLAKDLKVPVLALSQLNRSVEQQKDKRPQLSDLRESGAIEQDADAVWFLFRPAYYDTSASKGEVELNVAKQRNGPTGIIELYFEGRAMRFYNSAGSRAAEDVGFEFDTLDDV